MAHRDRGGAHARAGHRRRQLDAAESLHAGRPVAVVDHVWVRHRVARHHRLALADARDPVRRHGVPSRGGLLLVDNGDDGARLAGPQRGGGEGGRRMAGDGAGVGLRRRLLASPERGGDLVGLLGPTRDPERPQNGVEVLGAEGDGVGGRPGEEAPGSWGAGELGACVPAGLLAPGNKLFLRKSIPGSTCRSCPPRPAVVCATSDAQRQQKEDE